MAKNSKWSKLLKWSFIAFLSLLILVIACYEWISYSTQNNIYSNIEEVQPHKTALVLGTSKYVRGGQINLFFKYRMEAVAELFKNQKVKYIIVSGDNSIKEYNETKDMKQYLMGLGVPENRIIEDFAGFRTLDSVVRAKEVFGQNSVIVVSQPFHNERAVFIGKNHNMNVVGYNAQSVKKSYSIQTHLREYLARVKCVLDIYILNTKPKFYKEKENFPE